MTVQGYPPPLPMPLRMSLNGIRPPDATPDLYARPPLRCGSTLRRLAGDQRHLPVHRRCWRLPPPPRACTTLRLSHGIPPPRPAMGRVRTRWGCPAPLPEQVAQGLCSRQRGRGLESKSCSTPPPLWSTYTPPPPLATWPTAKAVALLRVDSTRSSETGKVRGLCWHNRPRERKGKEW